MGNETSKHIDEEKALKGDLMLSRSMAVDLLVEIDDTKLRQIPIIAAEYEMKIGCWKSELLRSQIELRREKRKLELVQACTNRGRAANMRAIDKQIDSELMEWKEKLLAVMDRYQNAMEYRSALRPAGKGELERVKTLYRKLAVRLHPDLHPGDEQTVSLFVIATNAYEAGNLEVLESLEVATRDICGYDEESLDNMTIDELAIELEICEAHVSVLIKKLEELKRNKPYCYKLMLEDPAQVEMEVRKYRKKIEACNASAREYRNRCKKLLEEADANPGSQESGEHER